MGEKHSILSDETKIGEIEIVGIHPPNEVYFTVEIEDGFNLKLEGGPFFECEIPPGGQYIEKVWVNLNEPEGPPAKVNFRWKIQ